MKVMYSDLNSDQLNGKILDKQIKWCIVFISLAVVALVCRLYYLQVIQYKYHSAVSESNRIHLVTLQPRRGTVYDRNGVVLAANKVSLNLSFTRERSSHPDEVLKKLSSVLQLSDIQARLIHKAANSVRRAYEPAILLRELTEEQVAKIAVDQYQLDGVDISADFVREYPCGSLFAHSLGYVGRISEQEQRTLDQQQYRGASSVGKTGVEKFYESQLRGKLGYQEVETNVTGRVMRVLAETPPVAGQDIHLTIDFRLQQAATTALAGRRGAIIALDPRTGEVLALVSQPSFDPNLFVNGISRKDFSALNFNPDRPLFNRALKGLYAPGSTIKPQIAVAGLDAGVITPSSRVFDPGYYQLPGSQHKFRNWNRSGEGWINLHAAIMRSNDVYFYDTANKLGVDKVRSYLRSFGLGRKVSTDLGEEVEGLMPSPEWKKAKKGKPWYPGETLILGIGQGYMQVTPLQQAVATGVVATKGAFLAPHIARAVGAHSIVGANKATGLTIHDQGIWDVINEGMQAVLHDPRGSGHAAGHDLSYRIAGKSGTAQVVGIRQGERYNRFAIAERHRDNALFVGFAPADAPEIAVAVIVENGEAGGKVAAPIMRKVMDAWLVGEKPMAVEAEKGI